ncbi:hypothetical protein DFH29DRAFT_496607 [Suillus ampliporus]|nr:hypothetical protein DFH29DRAFT_496607 [Suillus ampliporus]
MTLLRCAVLLYFPLFCASLPTFNGTSVPTLDASDTPFCNDTRTLWNIIWSCVATLIACTWTAVHPNIPGIDEKKFPVACRRLFIMVMALVAPELMITWAARQFLSATRTKEKFNELLRKNPKVAESKSASAPKVAVWTVTHGYFAWMGGFVLYVDGIPPVTLTPDELLDFVSKGNVEMPAITEADIEDQSKGDGLSKGIAILQLGWFVLQLLARYAQNLPATLLEVDTLAIAALTFIAYCLWWKKPKNVGRPYRVHWKATDPPGNLTYNTAGSAFSRRGCFAYLLCLVYPLLSLMGIEATISPDAARSRRVPSLGGYGKDERSDLITVLVGCLSGMLFGAIHCLGWYFSFHSQPEQILWRTASLVVVCTPPSISLFFGFLFVYDRMHDLHRAIANIIASSLFCGGVITCVAYIPARITLVTLMILSLRSLPPGSGIFDVVVWTKFILHW